MNNKSGITHLIRKEAKRLGFSEIGISKAVRLTDEEKRLKKWLDKGYHASMDYMENHFDKRVDPSKLVPGAKSVISLLYNYYTEKKQYDKNTLKVSKYAYGRDYHKVIKKKLNSLLKFIKEKTGDINGRAFVDSAPVLEKAWAAKSGLGWIGKNTLLINKYMGSYIFLSELIIDLELIYDEPVSSHCGNCTRCIDACPTEAISKSGYELDSTKCISYLTIENKGDIPVIFQNKMANYIFGCDICQDVCPWNRFAGEHSESDFAPKEEFLNMKKEDWFNISEEKFKILFYGTPVVRAKYKGLKRNIKFVKSSKKDQFD